MAKHDDEVKVHVTYFDATALLAGEASNCPDYAAVIVDEAQDMGAPAFRLLRAIAPPGQNDLFVAGDGHSASTAVGAWCSAAAASTSAAARASSA